MTLLLNVTSFMPEKATGITPCFATLFTNVGFLFRVSSLIIVIGSETPRSFVSFFTFVGFLFHARVLMHPKQLGIAEVLPTFLMFQSLLHLLLILAWFLSSLNLEVHV